MKALLSDAYLRSIAPPSRGRSVIVDAKGAGLVLRVTDRGTMAWAVRYRPKGQAQRRETLGPYPGVTLAEARVRALEITAAAKRGIDLPKKEREDRRRAEATARTFGSVVQEYIEQHCKPNQRRWRETERLFEGHLTERMKRKPLFELRRADILEFLDSLRAKTDPKYKAARRPLTTQINRVLAQIKAVLNWAVEREYLEANPAAAVKKPYRGEKPRDRILSRDELRAIWQAVEELTEPSRSLVKVWILTGQRRDEVRCMRWDELDEKTAVWTIPPERNKAKRRHEVPLPPALAGVLEALPRIGAYVFAIDAHRPYAGQRSLKEILDRKSGVAAWTFHDIRRTVASGMAALHVPHEIIGRVLNHARADVTAVYNRHQYLEEKRKALATWADHVAYIVSDARDARNVVALR